MVHGVQETSHVWLVMMKAMRALTRYTQRESNERDLATRISAWGSAAP